MCWLDLLHQPPRRRLKAETHLLAAALQALQCMAEAVHFSGSSAGTGMCGQLAVAAVL